LTNGNTSCITPCSETGHQRRLRNISTITSGEENTNTLGRRVKSCHFFTIKQKQMKKEIMEKLQKYHQQQGIAFLSKDDAEDYFKGLVEIVEDFAFNNKPITSQDKPLMSDYEKEVYGLSGGGNGNQEIN